MQYAQTLAVINNTVIKKTGLGSFAKIIAIIILVVNLIVRIASISIINRCIYMYYVRTILIEFFDDSKIL